MVGNKARGGRAFRIAIRITMLAVILLGGIGMVRAEIGMPNMLQETGFPDPFQMPGRLEANGTHFELKNSSYLNIILDSTEPIKLILESAPEMVTMHIESASDAASAQITISGFLSLTTYHKYEDDYHNHTAFTVDASGNYSYTQDLSKPHLVFIQPRASTKFINDNATGGDCTLIGTWNASTKTCTLTADLTETIQIDSNGLTLDGSGHTITGSGTGSGVFLSGRNNVMIKNLNVKSFYFGIFLGYSSSNSNMLSGNSVSNNRYGIYLYSSSSNMLSGNSVSNNRYYGIYLYSSSSNTMSGNSVSNNEYGIFLDSSSNNTLTSNNASNNRYDGIYLEYSSNNILTSNNASNNRYEGIFLDDSSNNILTSNDIANNQYDGIWLYGSSNVLISNNVSNNYWCGIDLYYSNNNKLTSNNVSNNYWCGIELYDSSNNNLFYHNDFVNNTIHNAYDEGANQWDNGYPSGGNYWSDYTSTDANNDGIGDTPYNISGGSSVDRYPLMKPFENYEIAESPWPMFQHDPQRTGRSPYTGTAEPNVKWVFTFEQGQSKPPQVPSVGVPGVIYISHYAIRSNGSLAWITPIIYSRCKDCIGPFNGAAIASDGTIYTGYNNEVLYTVNPDGSLKWKFEPKTGLGSGGPFPAISSDGTIYVPFLYTNFTTILFALSTDGTLKWSYHINKLAITLPTIAPDGTIYLVADGLYAIRPDGRLRWIYRLPVASTPVVSTDGTVYISSTNSLYAIHPTGTLKWKASFPLSGWASIALGRSGVIYVSSSNENTLYALNYDGSLLWSYTLDTTPTFPVVDAEGTVYIATDYGGYIYAINADGSLKWKYQLAANEAASSPVIGEDGTVYVTIYVGGANGKLYAFGLIENKPPNPPINLAQFKSDGTEIPEGGATGESTVIFKGTVSDPDGDNVRLEIELRRIDEPFTGEPTLETISDFAASGTEVGVARYGLVDGDYHWQYRAKDSKGAVSEWRENGTAGNTDFTVQIIKPPNFLTLPFEDPDIMVGYIFDATSKPLHYGIDFIKKGSSTWQPFDVVAAADGEAFWAEGGGWGKYVYIKHDEKDAYGNKYYTLYSHLESVNPSIHKEGEPTYRVERGQFVGKAGNTGAEGTGIHLHFEVHKGDARSIKSNRVDPYDLNQDRDTHYGEKATSIRCGPNYLWTTDPPSLPPISITVTSPNGGESWQVGTIQTIHWTYTGNPGSDVKIELIKGGVIDHIITSSTPIGSSGSGSFLWTIPRTQTLGTDYQVRITSTTNSAYTDISDGNFDINVGYAIIVAGNGGWREQWSFDFGTINAYRVLRNLGFDDDHIFYLSDRYQDVDGDGLNEVDFGASYGNFKSVIETINQKIGDNPAQVVVYLHGHGPEAKDGSGEPYFAFTLDKDYIWGSQLQDMLGKFSSKTRMLTVFGTCMSGLWITEEKGISDPNRIIITATHNDQNRFYLSVLRFTDRFFKNLNNGLNVKEAYVKDADTLGRWQDRDKSWLDDNGDRIGHPPDDLKDDGTLAASTQIGVQGTENLKLSTWINFGILSPGEISIYDSQGKVTGIVNGEIKEEIPNSIYEAEDKNIAIFSPSDTYRYVVTGTETGTYGLDISFIKDNEIITFTATNIPTTTGQDHQYTIDWTALSRGEEGVTLQIDSNGDGIFEQTITSNSELTHDEFMLQTGTTIDFDPDTLNLKSKGEVVTAYIELPEGYDVSQIDISTIKLNKIVPALAKPTEIGDHDSDGIADLMVKFDRAAVIGLFAGKPVPADYVVEVMGTVKDVSSTFKGSDVIRVISGEK